MRSALLLAIVLALASSHAVAGPDSIAEIPLVVPSDLHEFAVAHSCVPPASFYARPGVRNPPYVYAEDASGSDAAAVLWCRPAAAMERYTLLFRPGTGDVGLGACPAAIPDQTHIGGLSLFRPGRVNLGLFGYVDSPGRPGPERTAEIEVGVRSFYDGVGAEYVCDAGRWLVRRFH